MKKIVMKILAFLSRAIIKKYKPKVVGVTGSVGKTGTKELIASVLSTKLRVRSSIKNYNNEFGLPLTIIGLESPGKNLLGWLKVIWQAKKLLIFKDKNYPEVLVLEMGIDREGDMDYLLSIVRPDVGVLTNISHSHAEYLGSLEKIKKEKVKLLKGLKKDGVAIFNLDNKHLKNLGTELKGKFYSYGLDEGSNFHAKDLNFVLPKNLLNSDFYGINFKLEQSGSVLPIILLKAISYPQVYSALASLAVGFSLGLNLVEISRSLKDVKPIPGRMNVLSGIKNSIIIDDTYNSSPESSLSALSTMDKVKLNNGSKKLVIFGGMLELGNYSEEGHRLVGRKSFEVGINLMILIGEKARDIGRGAISAGFKKDNVFNFSNIDEALPLIKDRISEGDLILVKASQGGRLEKVVKEIMSEPDRAKEFLVRQEEEWL